MALREFRYYFDSQDKKLSYRLHGKYGNWIVGFKHKMKGRHKEFGGVEVKGFSIVNLHLYDKNEVNNSFNEWTKLLNTIEIGSHCDLAELENMPTSDGLRIIYTKYTQLAVVSKIPQIAKMPDLLIGDILNADFNLIAQQTKVEMDRFSSYINSKEYVYGPSKR